MNRRNHRALGAASAATNRVIQYLVRCAAQGTKPTFEDIVAKGLRAAVVGGLASDLPDLVDPPDSPRHRGVGHALVPATSSLGWTWYRSRDETLPPWLRETMQDAAVGVASHLVADGFTPDGIRLICGKA